MNNGWIFDLKKNQQLMFFKEYLSKKISSYLLLMNIFLVKNIKSVWVLVVKCKVYAVLILCSVMYVKAKANLIYDNS